MHDGKPVAANEKGVAFSCCKVGFKPRKMSPSTRQYKIQTRIINATSLTRLTVLLTISSTIVILSKMWTINVS